MLWLKFFLCVVAYLSIGIIQTGLLLRFDVLYINDFDDGSDKTVGVVFWPLYIIGGTIVNVIKLAAFLINWIATVQFKKPKAGISLDK